MKLSKYTLDLLEDIENRIDPDNEEGYLNSWEKFWQDDYIGEVFTPNRQKIMKPGVEIKNININDALNDMELMLIRELAGVSGALASTSNVPAIRANYGTGIMTSLFGAKVFTMPYHTNTLPTTYPLANIDEIRKAFLQGVPSLTMGLGKKVFETAEFYAEALKNYPKIQKYLQVYHPDAQGPLDIAELLWGGEMFFAMYDEPEFVHEVLDIICDTYIAFINKWYEYFPANESLNAHWCSLMYKGKILIRNDSAVNLSPDFYKEFSLPYDQKLLEYFGGGASHFCGRGDHYIELLSSIKGVTAINMSQPHLNDTEKIFEHTIDKNIRILDLPRGDYKRVNKTLRGVHYL